jgi:type II secretory pathway pseudopilin PulG
MSDGTRNGVQKLLDQLTDPWDYAAAMVGAAGGVAATILMHGTDGGTFAAGGASGAVGLRKLFVASRQRAALRKRARGLAAVIGQRIEHYRLLAPAPQERPAAELVSELNDLHAEVELEIDLWESDRTATANDRFAQKLTELENELRSVVSGHPAAPLASAVSARRRRRRGRARGGEERASAADPLEPYEPFEPI